MNELLETAERARVKNTLNLTPPDELTEPSRLTENALERRASARAPTRLHYVAHQLRLLAAFALRI